MKTTVSATVLCEEIQATFDDIVADPIPAGRMGCAADGCLRIAGEGCMPDGLPIFSTLVCNGDEYNGPVHIGFERWLSDRGYGWERWDSVAYIATPKSEGAIA